MSCIRIRKTVDGRETIIFDNAELEFDIVVENGRIVDICLYSKNYGSTEFIINEDGSLYFYTKPRFKVDLVAVFAIILETCGADTYNEIAKCNPANLPPLHEVKARVKEHINQRAKIMMIKAQELMTKSLQY